MARSSHLTLVTLPDGARGAAWLATLAGVYAPAEVDALTRAIEWLNARLQDATAKGGEPALDHALNVATILRELKLDAECLVACLLVPVASGHDALVEIRDRFGARVAELADGVSAHGDDRKPERRRRAGRWAGAARRVAQDAARDGAGRARRADQARRSHAVDALPRQVRRRAVAPRHGAPDARPVRAARQSARRVAAQVGARRPRVAHTGAGDLQAHRQPARRKAQRPRALHRSRGRSACARSFRVRASRPTSAAGPSTSTASTTKCAARQLRSTRFTTCAPCACWSTASTNATRRSTWCIACGRRCRASSTITSRSPRATITARCTLPSRAMTASRSKSRFARSRCTSTPNSGLPRTGATRKARATRPRTTRKSRGCGRSSSGKTRSRTRRSSPRGFRAIFLRTRFTC